MFLYWYSNGEFVGSERAREAENTLTASSLLVTSKSLSYNRKGILLSLLKTLYYASMLEYYNYYAGTIHQDLP